MKAPRNENGQTPQTHYFTNLLCVCWSKSRSFDFEARYWIFVYSESFEAFVCESGPGVMRVQIYQNWCSARAAMTFASKWFSLLTFAIKRPRGPGSVDLVLTARCLVAFVPSQDTTSQRRRKNHEIRSSFCMFLGSILDM